MLVLRNLEALYLSRHDERRGVDVLIDGRTIAAIGSRLTVPAATREIDGTGKIALPGLVNAHHHFFQILTRCLPAAQNAPLFDWLLYHYDVWRHIDAETIDAAARLALAELLLTGCTTSADHHYLFPKHVTEDLIGIEVQAARDLGIRFCATRGAMTLGRSKGGLPLDELVEDDERVLVHSEASIRRWHDPAPLSMCQLHLAPCSPFNVTPFLMRECAALARRYHVRLHTHLAETQEETEFCEQTFGKRPLDLMEEYGWVGEDVWFAHGIHFTDDELRRLAAHRCGIAHCPSSNMRLASGAARVPELLARGVPVGLAVDGSASNDSSDMLGELRQALLLNRLGHGSHALSARDVISLATAGSARLLGRPELGTLSPGQAADIALFDFEQLGYAGAADPIAALLLCGFNHTASMVIVNGEIVVENSRLTRVNQEEIRTRAITQSRKLWSRAGVL